jgi:hypothetical protein
MIEYRMNDAVKVLNDIPGTGVEAGAVGRVIAVQNGTRSIGRSTDLSPHAVQVRFKGGAEIWMTRDEVAPAMRAEGERAPTLDSLA